MPAIYVVDAFARGPFSGNPAAVVPLESWLPEATLQSIAVQNNLSETAFFVDGDPIELRWFTPKAEIDLCGHATLASAHVLFSELDNPRENLRFSTASGVLTVSRDGEDYVMDFPARADRLEPCSAEESEAVRDALGVVTGELQACGIDRIVLFEESKQVAELAPDFAAIAGLPIDMLIATAPGKEEFDVTARVFAPALGIPEDPATGSAYCILAPYWSERLGRDQLDCFQASARGGYLRCRWREAAGRVDLIGKCRTFSRGEFEL
jgi:PhzF family phenazine biosynthesis protein